MGLDIYLKWDGMTNDEKQARYTGYRTTGKDGYLRSSYNNWGNSYWMKTNLGIGLTELFENVGYQRIETENDDDDYYCYSWDRDQFLEDIPMRIKTMKIIPIRSKVLSSIKTIIM